MILEGGEVEVGTILPNDGREAPIIMMKAEEPDRDRPNGQCENDFHRIDGLKCT